MFTNYLHFPATQLSATSTSRAAFMQCLRWGAWCPFQEPDDWKGGGEVQLVLQGGGGEGGALPNPYGVMVYSAHSAARTPSSAPMSAADGAQVKAAAAAARARILTKERRRMKTSTKQRSRRWFLYVCYNPYMLFWLVVHWGVCLHWEAFKDTFHHPLNHRPHHAHSHFTAHFMHRWYRACEVTPCSGILKWHHVTGGCDPDENSLYIFVFELCAQKV